MTTTDADYPQLTDEILEFLMFRLANFDTTLDDFQMVDHYLTSAGYKGLLKRVLWGTGIYSFKEAAAVANKFPSLQSAEARGTLKSGIIHLQECIDAGQKIY